MKLVIVSPNVIFLDRCKEYFASNSNITITNGWIQDIKREGAAFVSPANSLGFMDGGIDEILSRHMFPGCEKEVKKKIAELAAQGPQANLCLPVLQEKQAELGHTTLLGRPYLRVGSALWVPVGEKTALISAPTMFLPHPIPHTRNVYWAMQASLVCVQKIPFVDTLVITSMGCGTGCMDPEEAAIQIRDAWREYEEKTLPHEVEDRGNSYAILESHDNAQPSNYDNREIGIPWPAGWNIPKAIQSTGPVKQIPILHYKNSVCYDA